MNEIKAFEIVFPINLEKCVISDDSQRWIEKEVGF
jgi:hypothetical protein